MIIIPPNMVDDQFMVEAVTGWASGQNAKNQIGVRNRSAAMLIARPNFPNDHRRGGKGSPLSRLHIKQLIVMKYEVSRETPPRELIAFKAVDEPILIQASRELTTRETQTARSGIFQPGDT